MREQIAALRAVTLAVILAMAIPGLSAVNAEGEDDTAKDLKSLPDQSNPETYFADLGDYLDANQSSSLSGRVSAALYDLSKFQAVHPRPSYVFKDLKWDSFLDGLGQVSELAWQDQEAPNMSEDAAEEAYYAYLDTAWDLEDEPNGLGKLIRDYENEYQNPYVIDWPSQAGLLPRRSIDNDQNDALEKELTTILERVRLRASAKAASFLEDGTIVDHFQQVEVRIGGSGLNVTASKGATQLIITPDVLHDLYTRSTFRAGQTLATSEEITDIFSWDMERPTCLEGFECGALPHGVQRYQALLRNLPGLVWPILPREHLYDRLVQIKDPELIQDRDRFVGMLGCYTAPQGADGQFEDNCNQSDSDVLTYMGRSQYSAEDAYRNFDQIVEFLAEHQGGETNVIAIRRYGEEYKALIEYFFELDELEEDPMEILGRYAANFLEIALYGQAIEAELQKSLLFLLAHEGFHLWINDLPLKSVEFEADRFAVEVYSEVFPELSQEAFFSTDEEDFGQIGSMISTGDSEDAIKNLIFGRSPDQVFEDTYKGTSYYDGSFTHPPFADRVTHIKERIDQNAVDLSTQLATKLECLISAEDEASVQEC